MTNQHNHALGIIAIIIASFMWGTTGTAASFAPDVSALAIGAIATGGGGLLMCLKALPQLLKQRSVLMQHSKIVLLGSLSVAVYPLAFYSSMRLAGVAIGTVVSIASAPCFAVMLEWVLNGRKITAKWTISFALGASGILLLALRKPESSVFTASAEQRQWGILLGLVAGLTYAAYSWTGKALITHGASSGVSMASQFGVSACLLLPSLFFTGDNVLASATNISVAFYMAVLPIFVGYLLFGYGLKSVDASTATLITLLEPVVATILAVLILNERFSLLGWGGIVLIGACIAVQMVNRPPALFRRRYALRKAR